MLEEKLNDIIQRTKKEIIYEKIERHDVLVKDYKEKLALVKALKESVKYISDMEPPLYRDMLKIISKILDGGGINE